MRAGKPTTCMDWKILVGIGVVVLGAYALKRAAFISAAEARKHLTAGALVIDVRSPGEFQADNVPGAINIPLGELREALPKHVKDKQQVLLLHCLSGGRSAIAKQQARGLGYANALNLGSLARAKTVAQSTRQASR